MVMKSNIEIVRDYLNGDRPVLVFGYTGDKNKHRSEGETWSDNNGVEWQRKDGKNVRLTKSQADTIRDAIGKQTCKCGLEIKWGNKFDRLFFAKTGMCQDCLIDYETRLRIAGVYPIYEKYKVLSNQLGFLEDIKAKLLETIDYFKTSDGNIELLCNSEGFMEKFHGTNKDKILDDAKKDLKECRKLIKVVLSERTKTKKELKIQASQFKIKLYV